VQRLTADGLDAGPLTLQWNLAQHGQQAPSTIDHPPQCWATTG
jgi:hypothetical protein